MAVARGAGSRLSFASCWGSRPSFKRSPAPQAVAMLLSFLNGLSRQARGLMTTAAAHWNLQRNRCALAIARGNCEFAAQPRSPLAHARKAAPVARPRCVEPFAVVGQFQHEPTGPRV